MIFYVDKFLFLIISIKDLIIHISAIKNIKGIIIIAEIVPVAIIVIIVWISIKALMIVTMVILSGTPFAATMASPNPIARFLAANS